MDGVGISIIERPRPLPGHDTPNPTEHPYTLKCEEPENPDPRQPPAPQSGSSPLTRGKLHADADLIHRDGLIPAHAGKTRPMGSS